MQLQEMRNGDLIACRQQLTSYTLRCMGLRRSQTIKSFFRPMLAGLAAPEEVAASG